MIASERTSFRRRGHIYYSFPRGFYHPHYTTVNVPVSAVPRSQSDSFHERTFTFDPKRYFLPNNLLQRQNRQRYDVHAAENRDNFHNFVLSGIHQHLYLVNNNVTQLGTQYKHQRADADREDASNNCTNLATTDPTYSFPGCTCTYSSSSSSKPEFTSENMPAMHGRYQGATAMDVFRTRTFSESSNRHGEWTALGTRVQSPGQTASGTTPNVWAYNSISEYTPHNASSQEPVWQIQKITKTAHRTSSATETDTENGVNYHIQNLPNWR